MLRDLPLLARGSPDYEAWLYRQTDTGSADGVPLVDGGAGRARGVGRDTLDRRIAHWLMRQGASRAFEFHQQELGEIRGHLVTSLEAAEDYVARLQPGGTMFEFLRLGQVAILHGNVLIDHGGVSRSNIGFVPGATSRIADPRQWITALNAYGREQMELIERAARSQGRDASFPDGFIRYADAIWDASARAGSGALFMNDVSLIYPFRQRERGNFRAPDEQAIAYLRAAGIDTEIVGHSPFGDVPGPLKAEGFLRLMADTSHRRAGAHSTITIDAHGGIRARGYDVFGFIQQGAIAAEIGMVEMVVLAGAHQDWSAPLLAALTVAEAHGGYAVFVGGGSIVGEGIDHAAHRPRSATGHAVFPC
ncbi:MAG: hypothetical protein FAZ92_03159 [Accumulibacter sp.]|uniref:hypothetical protein n=1 Tax=Accumulibacter sp. TaxID=2053492 RepID=UPI001205C3F2|nr:hypothetical protein [Accumulibacter sp.]TLD44609.1 MAG: hypothetical protein FAZ92_03159 [Accumulibacter sp.]